jgi:hypothetical protein
LSVLPQDKQARGVVVFREGLILTSMLQRKTAGSHREIEPAVFARPPVNLYLA